MQFGSWIFNNPKYALEISKISVLFSSEIKTEGDSANGKIVLSSEKKHDDVWGPVATLDISWEKKDRAEYHHGLKVKETIRKFSAIEVVANRKETHWHLSHEMTYWFGTRQQILHKRYYPTNIIHGVWYCELSSRLFEYHAVCTTNNYQQFEQAFLDAVFSLKCHE